MNGERSIRVARGHGVSSIILISVQLRIRNNNNNNNNEKKKRNIIGNNKWK